MPKTSYNLARRVAAAAALAVCAVAGDARAWTFKLLHTFTGAANDGADSAYASLIEDKAGDLYGTTAYGGAYGNGIAFKLAPDGTFTVLHSFEGSDGYWPYGDVIRDSAGNLYGTTLLGGANGDGVVFKIGPDGTETILRSFAGDDGKWPYANLTRDKAGDLYGTTSQGGVGNCRDWSDGCGTAFKIAFDGTFTKLHDFTSNDGEEIPLGTLAMDQAGNLYGTTNGCPYYAGTIFELAPDGTESILYALTAKVSFTRTETHGAHMKRHYHGLQTAPACHIRVLSETLSSDVAMARPKTYLNDRWEYQVAGAMPGSQSMRILP